MWSRPVLQHDSTSSPLALHKPPPILALPVSHRLLGSPFPALPAHTRPPPPLTPPYAPQATAACKTLKGFKLSPTESLKVSYAKQDA